MHILIINGPNLNLTGQREPAHYGTVSFDHPEQLFDQVIRRYPGLQVTIYQSNHEGDLVDAVQRARENGFSGIIVNPGAFTHTSVALADALRAAALPVVEVHLSHIYTREVFRRHNLIATACIGSISGLGIDGYLLAAEYLANHSAGE